MTHAPGGLVFGGIAYRGDLGCVFGRACLAYDTASRRCACDRGSGQPGRYRQTNGITETVKTCAAATSQGAPSAACRNSRTARAGCRTGAATPAIGKTETEAQTQAETQSNTQAKTRAKSRVKAKDPTAAGGAETETKTQEAG